MDLSKLIKLAESRLNDALESVGKKKMLVTFDDLLYNRSFGATSELMVAKKEVEEAEACLKWLKFLEFTGEADDL